jgi:hypothetical protein
MIYTLRETPNIEEIFNNNPDLVPLYINLNTNDRLTTLKLSKTKGGCLYALSNQDFSNIYNFLNVDQQKELQKNIIPHKTNDVIKKRGKQPSLLGFMKKRD